MQVKLHKNELGRVYIKKSELRHAYRILMNRNFTLKFISANVTVILLDIAACV